MKKKIMVVDDEAKALAQIAEILEKEGYIVATFSSAVQAIKAVEVIGNIDLILTDIRMPTVGGVEVLTAALAAEKPIPTIVYTGYGDVDTAVNMMRAGASDFLCKPVSGKELAIRIKRVLEGHEIASEVESLRKRLSTAESFHSIVGKSKQMMEVYGLINAVAGTDTTVLIRGETGTGKELVARAIHRASTRKREPFVPISCTALQSTLLESELFGHEKGAFTGAHAIKAGKLESAGNGTVFLDEVGDTSPEIQAKLLRVLQEKEFERVGGIKPIKLSARVLAATNRDLEEAVRDKHFREDLYFRLNVVQIDLPPLRERDEDIVLLANHFLELYKKRYDKPIEGFSPQAVEEILGYDWPGNVREIANAIERTVLTNPRRWIDHLTGLKKRARGADIFGGMPDRLDYLKARETVFDELEKAYLLKYMREERGQINKVAGLMGVSTRTVARRLEKYNLDKWDFKHRAST